MSYPRFDQIRELQEEIGDWAKRNFPGAEPWTCLLGLQEELGELSHAWLKRRQKIRQEEDHVANIGDSVGDIFVYLAHFCELEGLDLQNCVTECWGKVGQRDWTAEREEGEE